MGEKIVKRSDYLNWDQYFMALALIAAKRSKDPVTQTGAVIVDRRNKIISIGYNGFPTGCSDDVFPWQDDKEGPVDTLDNKHYYVVHSELNAILNARCDLTGTTMYTTLFPCNECAKAIIQAGIRTVIYGDIKHGKDYTRAAKRMFDSAGVLYKMYMQSKKEVRLML